MHQRLSLRNKASSSVFQPHQLVMTATPIPRTLAMSVYADLDSTVIKDLPPGRLRVNTAVISNEKRADIVKGLKTHVLMGDKYIGFAH